MKPTERLRTPRGKYCIVRWEPFSLRHYLSFFLWRSARLRFFRLCVLILCRLRFLPQGIHPPLQRFRRLQRQLRDHVLKFVGRLKHRNFPIRNRHDITRPRITGLACLAQLDLEGPKASNLDVVTILDRLSSRYQETNQQQRPHPSVSGRSFRPLSRPSPLSSLCPPSIIRDLSLIAYLVLFQTLC